MRRIVISGSIIVAACFLAGPAAAAADQGEPSSRAAAAISSTSQSRPMGPRPFDLRCLEPLRTGPVTKEHHNHVFYDVSTFTCRHVPGGRAAYGGNSWASFEECDTTCNSVPV
nr:hypothetical protein [Kibdelosporangium sp. MJ126-NF4]